MQLRPEGRYQCTRCRAAFASEDSARGASFTCPEEPLAHGHPYEREHVLYPYSYNRGDGYGPDRLCDEVGCSVCVGHGCDCDVCEGRIEAPALKVLMDSHEDGNTKQSPNWEKEEQMEDLKTMLSNVKVGDRVAAFGKTTTGAMVTRTGVLLAEPEGMRATHMGTKVDAIRVRVGEEGADPAKRSTWTTLIPGHGSILPAERPKEVSKDQAPDAAGTQAIELDWQSVTAVSVPDTPFLYGGKGTKGTAPQHPVKVTLGSKRFSGLDLLSVDSGEVVASLKNSNKVWVAVIPEGWRSEHADNEHQDVTGLGQPVHHVVTGDLVGYWTPEAFTPIEDIQR